jgi:ribosome-associated protein
LRKRHGRYTAAAPLWRAIPHRGSPILSTSRKTKPDSTAELRKAVVAALEELKAKDIREIDVRGKTSIADLLVIASGTSARHVKSIADEVVKFAKKAGVMPLGVEGEQEAEWVLVDLGDVIVHVMLPRIREFYGLERLWTVGDREPDVGAAQAG